MKMVSSGSAAIALIFCTIVTQSTYTSADHTWYSVSSTWIGSLGFHHAGTISFTIPSVIPSSAKEVLIYARAWSAGRQNLHADMDIKIFTQRGITRYEKYLYLIHNQYDAAIMNSDNMWFPMTPNRRLYVTIPIARLHSNSLIYLSAVGYRR